MHFNSTPIYISRHHLLKSGLSLALFLLFGPTHMACYPAIAGPVAPDLEKQPVTVSISADHQAYDQKSSRVTLSGHVEVALDKIVVKSPEAKIVLNETGSPVVANFVQRPTAVRTDGTKGKDDLQADVIRVLFQDNLVRAEGNVVTLVATVAEAPFHITSDVQQFNNATKTVEAEGSVNVKYKEFEASSPKAVLKVGKSGDAEHVLFLGGAHLKKEQNEIHGDSIKVMVKSGNLVAEGNVFTEVKDKNIRVKSDYQQYDKGSDTMLASGHVQIRYDDYYATGPKATFKMSSAGGGVDKILFSGRSTIVDKDRQITADAITISTNPKKFDALGNVKTKFRTQRGQTAQNPAGSGTKTTTPTKPGSGKGPTKEELGTAPRPLSKEEQELQNY